VLNGGRGPGARGQGSSLHDGFDSNRSFGLGRCRFGNRRLVRGRESKLSHRLGRNRSFGFGWHRFGDRRFGDRLLRGFKEAEVRTTLDPLAPGPRPLAPV